MNQDLKGKVAVVTGSSRGIGLAIAKALHAQGCQLVLNGRDQARLDAAAELLPGAITVAADACSVFEAQQLVRAVLKRFGRIDILVCNVGSGRSVPPGLETSEEWQRVFALNLWSATNAVEAARAPLKISRGNVVCISSICGMEVVPGAPLTYSAAKAALNAWVRGAARPLGQDGVRINAIAPGNMMFEGSVWERKSHEDPAAVKEMVGNEVALGRLGTPTDVADLAVFLCSSAAGFVTGAVFPVDGGQTRS
jgi:3-oxoacyl-[acyl-carrier protein] reductase